MKTFTTENKPIKIIFRIAAVAVFWIGLWYLISVLVSRKILLPSPADTLRALISLGTQKEFYISCLITFARILAGFISGVVFGTLFGWISYKSEGISLFITPLKSIIKATPVASFIILALVWIRKNNIPVFISMLIVIPIMWSSVESSLKSIDRKYFETADIFKLGYFKRIKYIIVPFIKKNYTGALETCFGIAWKAGVAAEVLCLPEKSIGKELYNSKIYLETDKMFAWTVCIIVISLLCEILIKKFLGRSRKENGTSGIKEKTNENRNKQPEEVIR